MTEFGAIIYEICPWAQKILNLFDLVQYLSRNGPLQHSEMEKFDNFVLMASNSYLKN